MHATPIIKFRDVQKQFGSVSVLNGLTVDVFAGEIFGLLGTNGAGKSTTISILTGQLLADGGAVEVVGLPAGDESNRSLGLAPQDIALYSQLTVVENLRFFAGVYGCIGAARRANVDRALDFLELRSFAHTRVEKLSGGWKRRLNLAVALVHRPQIAVLDESTVGMDVESRLKMWEAMRALKAEGVTILLTTHLMDEAEAVCDRIGILRNGQIAALGTMGELRQTVPAAQLADVECSDMQLLARRAKSSGFSTRFHAGRLTLLLPEVLNFRELIDQLAPVEIESARLRDISLSDVFLEIASTDQ